MMISIINIYFKINHFFDQKKKIKINFTKDHEFLFEPKKLDQKIII